MADFQRLMQLVEDALSLPSEERASFLRKACGSDQDLFDEANKLAAKTTSEVFEANAGVGDAETALPRVVVAGRYELGEIVGEGGMGTVHRARDLRFDRDVAVKLLKPGVPADSPAAMRFQVESRITGQLQHPGIPPAYELGLLPGGLPFLAMKLVRGRTLRTLLKDRTSATEDLSRFIAVFEQIAHAVGYAHSHRVIHRDLKPANVMVGAHGEVQVMDWGLAKAIGETPEPLDRRNASSNAETVLDAAGDLDRTRSFQAEIETPERGGSDTRTGSVMGTPAYMPPEQAAGDVRAVDARSDVFGLGAILCEILTGKPP